jgi:hypothetical protein
MKKGKAHLGQVKYHTGRKLYYIYEFDPKANTGKKVWLRLDTYKKGTWRKSPLKTAKAVELH